jgi:hypothetical protein
MRTLLLELWQLRRFGLFYRGARLTCADVNLMMIERLLSRLKCRLMESPTRRCSSDG